jgi:hypothetical protein
LEEQTAILMVKFAVDIGINVSKKEVEGTATASVLLMIFDMVPMLI